MPTFQHGDATIYYEEQGSGFPVLLIAPGGMRSSVSFWRHAPWDPIEHLSSRYRVIAMDQRNAGQSTAPVRSSDGWATFTGDQLALLDHLGVDRFHVGGMCIGGSYIAALAHTAPERVASGVVFQTIGLDANRNAFYDMFDSWANELAQSHPEVDDTGWKEFRESMYGGDDYLFSVPDAWIPECRTPLLVLLGNDMYHPESSSRRLAAEAPNATLVERWKDPEDHPAARASVEQFLAANTPGG